MTLSSAPSDGFTVTTVEEMLAAVASPDTDRCGRLRPRDAEYLIGYLCWAAGLYDDDHDPTGLI